MEYSDIQKVNLDIMARAMDDLQKFHQLLLDNPDQLEVEFSFFGRLPATRDANHQKLSEVKGTVTFYPLWHGKSILEKESKSRIIMGVYDLELGMLHFSLHPDQAIRYCTGHNGEDEISYVKMSELCGPMKKKLADEFKKKYNKKTQ